MFLKHHHVIWAASAVLHIMAYYARRRIYLPPRLINSKQQRVTSPLRKISSLLFTYLAYLIIFAFILYVIGALIAKVSILPELAGSFVSYPFAHSLHLCHTLGSVLPSDPDFL